MRCVHCLQVVEDVHMDHVIPNSWYPDTTPSGFQRWKAPSCLSCNGRLSAIEERLLRMIAPSFEKGRPETAGILEKVERSFGRSMRPIKPAELQKRRNSHKKFLAGLIEVSDYAGQFLPGFGPAPDADRSRYVGGKVSASDRVDLAEKLGRGLEHVLGNGRYIEAPYEIGLLDLQENRQLHCDALLRTFAAVHNLAPGMQVARASAPWDCKSVLYRVVIWGRLCLYIKIGHEDWALVHPPLTPGEKPSLWVL